MNIISRTALHTLRIPEECKTVFHCDIKNSFLHKYYFLHIEISTTPTFWKHLNITTKPQNNIRNIHFETIRNTMTSIATQDRFTSMTTQLNNWSFQHSLYHWWQHHQQKKTELTTGLSQSVSLSPFDIMDKGHCAKLSLPPTDKILITAPLTPWE